MNADKIRSYLKEEFKDIRIMVFDELDSTNAYAKKIARGGEKAALVIADAQTSGRGRLGRSFYSPRGSGLYMSLIVSGITEMAQSARITVAAGVAVCRGIEKLTDLKPKIKWVNDVFLDGKKVCGILAESVIPKKEGNGVSVVVGIGVNITKNAYPKEVEAVATALNCDISRSVLAAEITNNFMEMNKNLREPEILADYKRHMFILGREITYLKEGISYSGVAEDINEDGNLIVRQNDGEIVTLIAGEVTQHKN